MSTPLPNHFQTAGQPIINSFDFTDITSGLSYATYYPSTAGGPGNYTILQLAEDPGNSTNADTHERWTIITATRTFATPAFKFPRVIEGTVYFAFTLVHSDSASGSGSTITINMYKNTTNLGSTTFTGPTTNSRKTYLIPITISRTNINPGDTIGFDIGTDARGRVQFDPLNNDVGSFVSGGGLGTWPSVTASTNHTYFKFMVPFATRE